MQANQGQLQQVRPAVPFEKPKTLKATAAGSVQLWGLLALRSSPKAWDVSRSFEIACKLVPVINHASPGFSYTVFQLVFMSLSAGMHAYTHKPLFLWCLMCVFVARSW